MEGARSLESGRHGCEIHPPTMSDSLHYPAYASIPHFKNRVNNASATRFIKGLNKIAMLFKRLGVPFRGCMPNTDDPWTTRVWIAWVHLQYMDFFNKYTVSPPYPQFYICRFNQTQITNSIFCLWLGICKWERTIVYNVLYVIVCKRLWASVNFDVCEDPGTKPPWILRDAAVKFLKSQQLYSNL